MTKYAALSLATGLTCCPSFRQKTNNSATRLLSCQYQGHRAESDRRGGQEFKAPDPKKLIAVRCKGKTDLCRVDVAVGGANPTRLGTSGSLLAMVLPIFRRKRVAVVRVQQLGAVRENGPGHWWLLLFGAGTRLLLHPATAASADENQMPSRSPSRSLILFRSPRPVPERGGGPPNYLLT